MSSVPGQTKLPANSRPPDGVSKQWTTIVDERTEEIDVECVPRTIPPIIKHAGREDSYITGTDGCGWKGTVTSTIQRVQGWELEHIWPSYENDYRTYDDPMTCPNILADGELCGHPLTPMIGDPASTDDHGAARRDRMANLPETNGAKAKPKP